MVNSMGDPFTLLALPWLVLRLTGNSLALGWVLALLGLPRAAFILLAGAVVNRLSPQRAQMISKYVCTALRATRAALVLLDALTPPCIGVLALGRGLASAFSIPAGTSMLPLVLAPARLQAANSLLMGLRQLSFFVGPQLGRLLITLLGDGGQASAPGAVTGAVTGAVAGAVTGAMTGAVAGAVTGAMTGAVIDARGLGLVVGLDALSCAFSAWTLARVRFAPRTGIAAGSLAGRPAQPVLAAGAEGLRCCWRNQPLRTCLLYWSAVALLITGPVQRALPVQMALPVLAAHGAGRLTGMVGRAPGRGCAGSTWP